MNTFVTHLANRLLDAEHICHSSTGRHLDSRNVTRDSANGATVADGYKRSKTERDAFAERNAIRVVLDGLTVELRSEFETEKTRIAKERIATREANRAMKSAQKKAA